jgi:membrane-associated phospholipid phosphatase
LLALTTLALAVASGHAASFDQWSVDHLMPYQDRPAYEQRLWEQMMSPIEAIGNERNSLTTRLAFALTLPAAPLVSALFALGGLAAVARRGRAPVWVAALAAGAVAEVVMKAAIERPLLHRFDQHRAATVSKDAFNHSFPSGHTVRGVLVAALIAEAVPRMRPVLAAWLVAMSAALVASSMHTPTDVAGGLLLASIVLVVIVVVQGRAQRVPPDFDARPRAYDPKAGRADRGSQPPSLL